MIKLCDILAGITNLTFISSVVEYVSVHIHISAIRSIPVHSMTNTGNTGESH